MYEDYVCQDHKFFFCLTAGFWLLHCHIEYHGLDGMGLILQVGEPEDMPIAPRSLPKCGDFMYQDEEDDYSQSLLKATFLSSTKCYPQLAAVFFFVMCGVLLVDRYRYRSVIASPMKYSQGNNPKLCIYDE